MKFLNIKSDEIGDSLLGFHKRKDQLEQFLLERRFWNKYYPKEMVTSAEQMCNMSSIIIKNVLAKIGVPKMYWEKATGKCSDANGTYHLTFNHFRPEKNTRGLNAHKDDGYITMLRSTEPGLEILIEDKWFPLETEKNYFKINFGFSMEILTQDLGNPIRAVVHRVIQQKKQNNNSDRCSWGHFTSSKFDENADNGIYKYNKDKGLVLEYGARQLININDYEIYRN